MTYFIETLKSSWLLLLCLILARFIGLPANFTPILACAVFLPFMTDNKFLQIALPVGIVMITDPFLGFYSSMPIVYLCIVTTSIITTLFSHYSFKNMILSGLIGVGIWHIVVNFSVWYTGLSGMTLVSTYLAAIPFDLRLLASTVIFASLFYFFRSFVLSWYSRLDSN